MLTSALAGQGRDGDGEQKSEHDVFRTLLCGSDPPSRIAARRRCTSAPRTGRGHSTPADRVLLTGTRFSSRLRTSRSFSTP
jgi:hypothetical protein